MSLRFLASLMLSIVVTLSAPSIATCQEVRVNQPDRGVDGPTRDEPTRAVRAAEILADIGPRTEVNSKVDRLIDMLVSTDQAEAQATITAILSLGRPAIPQLLRKIDDRRAMPLHQIALKNHGPGAFEGVRYAGAEQVTDCINIILESITGEYKGMIEFSMDIDTSDPIIAAKVEKARFDIIKNWKIYVNNIADLPAVPNKSLPDTGRRF